MKGIKTATKIALFIAIFAPSVAFAQYWTTPSGVIVDDSGRIINAPKVDNSTVDKVLVSYKNDPLFYTEKDYKGCTNVYRNKKGPRVAVYTTCK